jgi:hypothetical protein
MHYLLMGAGFSRNWGGWLADEAFDYLLGADEVRQSPALRALIWRHREEGGFESALGELMREHTLGRADAADLVGLQAAIVGMFNQMNAGYLDRPTWEWGQDVARSVSGFMARFDALFTLNQDLLLEQHYAPEMFTRPDGGRWLGLELPGMTHWPGVGDTRARGLARHNWSAVPPEQFAVGAGMQPLYKLHGSAAWTDRLNGNMMILGDDKVRAIRMFPILNWYFEQFEVALNRGDAKLLVIGYGFRDAHVNEIIVRAIQDSGLQIYIVDLQGAGIARQLRRNAEGLIPGHRSELELAFERGLIGASRRPLRDVFGDDQIERVKLERFFSA